MLSLPPAPQASQQLPDDDDRQRGYCRQGEVHAVLRCHVVEGVEAGGRRQHHEEGGTQKTEPRASPHPPGAPQHQACDQIRPCRRQIQGDRSTERMTDDVKIEDDLYIRAVVFKDGQRRVLLLVLDTLYSPAIPEVTAGCHRWCCGRYRRR